MDTAADCGSSCLQGSALNGARRMWPLLLLLLAALPGGNGGGDITISAGGATSVFAGESPTKIGPR